MESKSAEEAKAPSLHEMLNGLGVGIDAFEGGGVSVMEARIPKGTWLGQHVHDYEHLSILASGVAKVEFEDRVEVITAPACITIPAGHKHRVTAITDVVWYCVHTTSEAEKIDAITAGDQHAVR